MILMPNLILAKCTRSARLGTPLTTPARRFRNPYSVSGIPGIPSRDHLPPAYTTLSDMSDVAGSIGDSKHLLHVLLLFVVFLKHESQGRSRIAID